MITENLITDHGNGVREEINSDGTIIWYKNDQVHRDDGPAVWKLNGVQQWYINAELHRENGPAIITGNEDGTKHWYINGELHRENGPAVETGNGERRWYINGLLHRDDDEPAIIRLNGTEEWYKDGQLHRDNAPAIIKQRPKNIFSNLSTEEHWYKNGMLHRKDGPAITKLNGEKYWYLNDQEITEKQFEIFKLQESLSQELIPGNETQPKKLKL